MENVYKQSQERIKGFALCVVAYMVALSGAVLAGSVMGGYSPIAVALAGIIVSTIAIYAFARFYGNASLFDPYWSVAPLVVAAYFFLISTGESGGFIWQLTVLLLVFLWSIRLTLNWARSWRGLEHEDWRYRYLKQKSGGWFWLVELAGIELMPALIIFAGCLPLYPALTAASADFSLLYFVAIAVTIAAIALEAVADKQLREFKAARADRVMDKGLWAYSRHPNYFGEVMFWWGLYLFGLAADPSYWWTVIGPIAVTVLFMTISIPLMENVNLKFRPGYREYQGKTSVFIPWFRKS